MYSVAMQWASSHKSVKRLARTPLNAPSDIAAVSIKRKNSCLLHDTAIIQQDAFLSRRPTSANSIYR
jgi:hypothetical protein